MPYKPKHPCAHPGCPELVPYGEKYDAWKEDAMPKIIERTRKNREALRTERLLRREEAM